MNAAPLISDGLNSALSAVMAALSLPMEGCVGEVVVEPGSPAASIALSLGTREVVLHLCLSDSTAQTICGAILGRTEAFESDVLLESVGEAVNLVAGRLSGWMAARGYETTLQTPVAYTMLEAHRAEWHSDGAPMACWIGEMD